MLDNDTHGDRNLIPDPHDPVPNHGSEGDPAQLDRTSRRREDPERKVKLSEHLVAIAQDESRERIAVNDLIFALKGRAIAALLLLFSFPNVLPSPPGTSGVLGLPLVYLSLQMMLGRPPWMPAFIGNRSMPRSNFSAIVHRSAPYLARAERLLRPRLSVLTGATGARAVGGVCLILSIVLFLPIPLGNMLPALAICILALGTLEQDGVWIISGTVLGVLSLVVVWGVIWAMIKAIVFLFGGFAG